MSDRGVELIYPAERAGRYLEISVLLQARREASVGRDNVPKMSVIVRPVKSLGGGVT